MTPNRRNIKKFSSICCEFNLGQTVFEAVVVVADPEYIFNTMTVEIRRRSDGVCEGRFSTPKAARNALNDIFANVHRTSPATQVINQRNQ